MVFPSWRSVLVSLVVCGMAVVPGARAQTPNGPCPDCCPEPPCDSPPDYPQRAVFYYPWWNGTSTPYGPCPWNKRADSRGYCRKWSEIVNYWFHPDFNGNGVFEPQVDLYNDNDPAVVQTQLQRMAQAWVSDVIVSWWGQGLEEDQKLENTILPAVRSQNLVSVTIYWEGKGNRSEESVAGAMATLKQLWNTDRTRMTLTGDGRPAIFLYSPWYTGFNHDRCELMMWWKQALDEFQADTGVRPFLVADFRDEALSSCPQYHSPGDYAWHYYSTDGGYYTERRAYGKKHTQTLTPGFARHCWPQPSHGPRECQGPEPESGIPRDPASWQSVVFNAGRWFNRPRYFQLIVSWNEWLEFTAVEPATEWHTTNGIGEYLNTLATYPVP